VTGECLVGSCRLANAQFTKKPDTKKAVVCERDYPGIKLGLRHNVLAICRVPDLLAW
jgi:hypothetical protein